MISWGFQIFERRSPWTNNLSGIWLLFIPASSSLASIQDFYSSSIAFLFACSFTLPCNFFDSLLLTIQKYMYIEIWKPRTSLSEALHWASWADIFNTFFFGRAMPEAKISSLQVRRNGGCSELWHGEVQNWDGSYRTMNQHKSKVTPSINDLLSNIPGKSVTEEVSIYLQIEICWKES